MHPSYESGVVGGLGGGRRFRCLGAVAGAAVVFAGVGLGGCAGYSNWPGEGVGLRDPSTRPNDVVMVEAMRWTVERFPPGTPEGRYALNLPVGLGPALYAEMVEKVGPRAEPVLERNRDLPTYHVKSLRVRGMEAEVLVLRPVTELGPTGEGQYALQPVTVWLKSSLRGGWRVVRSREWTVGMEEPPPLHVWRPERETAVAEGEPGEPETGRRPVPPEDAETAARGPDSPGKGEPGPGEADGSVGQPEGETVVEVIEVEEPGGS